MRIYIVAISIFFTSMAFGQKIKGDKFIRILGQAGEVIKPSNLVVDYTLSEIPPNEYKQIRYVPIEQVKENFEAFLVEANLNNKQINVDVEKSISSNRYNSNTYSDHYNMKLSNLDELMALNECEVAGFKLSEWKYEFPELPDDLELRMAKNAINDAREKANALAKIAGKVVGEIINIEAKTSLASGRQKSTTKQKDIKYSLLITFELL